MKTLIPLLFLLIALPAQAQTRLMADTKLSTIRYSMIHPLHEWDGVSTRVSSVIQLAADGQTIERVAVRVPVASFDSDNASRDSHMIEVTDALKYPDLRFSSTSITTNGATLTVNGVLTFHGVEKAMSFTAIRQTDGGWLRVTGSFPAELTDFGIDPPRLLGIATENKFTVSFDTRYPLN